MSVEPEGTQALVLEEAERASAALEQFRALSNRADVAEPEDGEERPRPQRVAVPEGLRGSGTTGTSGARMIELPGGTFEMRVRHERRECGCYPNGATADATWGWHYQDLLTHELRASRWSRSRSVRRRSITPSSWRSFMPVAIGPETKSGSCTTSPESPTVRFR